MSDLEARILASFGVGSAVPVTTSVLKTIQGHLLNAKIDLDTGSTKAAVSKKLEGILRMIDEALAKAGQS